MEPLAIFKRHVGYNAKADQDTFTGNGSSRVISLRRENVTVSLVLLDGQELASSGYEVDSSAGVLTFAEAPADGVVATIDYTFAPFTDAEAQALIIEYGLDRAVIEALRSILANQARMLNYQHGDTKVDHSQVFKQVKSLLEYYEGQLYKDESGQNTGILVGKRPDPRASGGDLHEPDVSRLYG